MKKLSKIKLVNWHLFSNQTIEIKDNVLISGENGSGKSTLLDALQYLFVGGRSGAKFNIAATDDARRTLEGYVRGRIGAENKEFLRTGDVISHVAMEFYDELNKTFSIIGVILDLPRTGNLKERFYILEDLAIDDSLFLEKKYPRDYKNMKAYLKSLDIELRPFDSQRKYRDAIARFFGLDAHKYAKILPKALAFRSIDLQQFVFEFLLDDDPIDIQSLKNNVLQLKKIELEIKRDKEKLEQLDKIMDLNDEIAQNKEQLNINELIDQLNFIEKREAFIKREEDALLAIEKNLELLRDKKEQIDDELDSYDHNILELERSKSKDDLSHTLDNYKENLRKKGLEYDNQKERIQDLFDLLEKEVDIAKKLYNFIKTEGIKHFIDYAQKQEFETAELLNYLTIFNQDIKGYEKAYHLEKDRLESNKRKLSDEIRGNQQQINKLKKEVKSYPFYVENLLTSLEQELSRYYQKDILVKPLCELIEVNDESWRNALEGYLSSQKFDIIVEPEYFNDALEIYERIKFEQKIYGVGLVNTNKIKNYDKTPINSLAEKVSTDFLYARNYVNMLLGGVTCVENVSELKNYNRAITKSCMTYGNHTARQINPRTYEIPFIGLQATKIQTEKLESQLLEQEREMQKLYNTTDQVDFIIKALESSQADRMIHQNQIRYFDLIKQTRREYLNIEKQIEDLSQDSNIEDIEKRINDLRQKRQITRRDQEMIIGEIATNRDDRQRIMDEIDNVKERLEEYQEQQRELNKKHPEKLGLANTQYYALKLKYKDFDKITNDIASSNVSLNQQQIKKETEMINLMRQYIHSYHFNGEPTVEGIDDFIKEDIQIRNHNLVKYEHEATELRRNSETGFKEEFVGKLRASIENAQQQIEELNLALVGKTFGTDTYQLTYKASDNPSYKVYYDIIMDSEAIEKQALFTENLTKKNEQILMELFEKIASADPEYDHLTYHYLDYRNYMSYDIEVTNMNGNKSYFSKVAKEKSGGETQVPFYIVIAASFQQLLSKNRRIDSGCIVLFDEAFNNMDESRIDAMMKFYNSLSIQLLIAVPPQRVSDIINYVNTSLVIVKDDDYAIVEAFKDNRNLRAL